MRRPARGLARDISGSRSFELDCIQQSTVSDFRKALVAVYPAMKELLKFSIAVNQEYVSDEMILNEGDEVAIIPPVSGG